MGKDQADGDPPLSVGGHDFQSGGPQHSDLDEGVHGKGLSLLGGHGKGLSLMRIHCNGGIGSQFVARASPSCLLALDLEDGLIPHRRGTQALFLLNTCTNHELLSG